MGLFVLQVQNTGLSQIFKPPLQKQDMDRFARRGSTLLFKILRLFRLQFSDPEIVCIPFLYNENQNEEIPENAMLDKNAKQKQKKTL